MQLSRPVYNMVCSATVGNPGEMAERLLARPVSLVDLNGAPCGERARKSTRVLLHRINITL